MSTGFLQSSFLYIYCKYANGKLETVKAYLSGLWLVNIPYRKYTSTFRSFNEDTKTLFQRSCCYHRKILVDVLITNITTLQIPYQLNNVTLQFSEVPQIHFSIHSILDTRGPRLSWALSTPSKTHYKRWLLSEKNLLVTLRKTSKKVIQQWLWWNS